MDRWNAPAAVRATLVHETRAVKRSAERRRERRRRERQRHRGEEKVRERDDALGQRAVKRTTRGRYPARDRRVPRQCAAHARRTHATPLA